MLKVLDGIVFEGKPSANEWDVSVLAFPNGQREVCVARTVIWEEVGPLHPDSIKGRIAAGEDLVDSDDAAKREASLKRAARRAKTRVRRLCKGQGFDSMLTLTYRENQTDGALVKAHVKEFVRRLRRNVKGFAFVAAFERQERGAWHVHMACHRVPPALRVGGVRVKSYDLLRSVWRSVTGSLGGTVNVSRGAKWKRRSPARLASYLSKYLLKSFAEGDAFSNRYSASEGFKLPPTVRVRLVAERMADVIALAFMDSSPEGADYEVHTWLSRFGDMFWCSSEPYIPPVGFVTGDVM